MKLYRIHITAPSSDEGFAQAFAGTMADAKVLAREFQRKYPNEKPAISPYEVPTDKTRLLAWVIANFSHDNG